MHVGEIGMSRAADEEIPAFSAARNAVVVTLDADFHTILAVSGLGTCRFTRSNHFNDLGGAQTLQPQTNYGSPLCPNRS